MTRNNVFTIITGTFIFYSSGVFATNDNNIPEPKCFLESKCLSKATTCREDHQAANSRVREIFTAILRHNFVCVAYNGTISRVSSVNEQLGGSDLFGYNGEGHLNRSLQQARALATAGCASSLAYYHELYDDCRQNIPSADLLENFQ